MRDNESQPCAYVDRAGNRCPTPVEQGELCFWHDPEVSKEGLGVREKLVAWAKRSGSMAGFSLARADLAEIRPVEVGSKRGLSLSDADLYRTKLRGAHLFGADLRGASLMKADLSDANLNCANFEGANLLGTNFKRARVEHVQWGTELVQETNAREFLRRGDRQQALDCFEQAEEIYRRLRKVTESHGLFENAGGFFRKEMIMRRLQLPPWSPARIFSNSVDLFCGYGEKPLNVVTFSVAFIVVCALCYFLLGIAHDGQLVGFELGGGLRSNLLDLANCLYFSVVTFTTLGYGDLTPLGWSRPLAAFEAFTGAFTLALFVVVFVKKMTR